MNLPGNRVSDGLARRREPPIRHGILTAALTLRSSQQLVMRQACGVRSSATTPSARRTRRPPSPSPRPRTSAWPSMRLSRPNAVTIATRDAAAGLESSRVRSTTGHPGLQFASASPTSDVVSVVVRDVLRSEPRPYERNGHPPSELGLDVSVGPMRASQPPRGQSDRLPIAQMNTPLVHGRAAG
jgi:hypothetical protein